MIFWLQNQQMLKKDSSKLYLFVSLIFFIFLLRSLFYENTWASVSSLSAMLPLPIIGLLILFTNDRTLRISPQKVAVFAKISVLAALLLYLILLYGLGSQHELSEHAKGRIELFSGNPIPFSVAIFGVSIFCFANWRSATTYEKLGIVLCYSVGLYFAGVLSGTRGTLLAILLSLPLLFWFITRTFVFSLILSFILGVFALLLFSSDTNF